MLGRRSSQLLPSVPRENVPEPGKAVDVLLAVYVVDACALAARPHVPLLMGRRIVERVNQMRLIPSGETRLSIEPVMSPLKSPMGL